MLAHSSPLLGTQPIHGAIFGEGTGPIFLDELSCNGDETTLLACMARNPRGVHMCDHSEDASVRCIGEFSTLDLSLFTESALCLKEQYL